MASTLRLLYRSLPTGLGERKKLRLKLSDSDMVSRVRKTKVKQQSITTETVDFKPQHSAKTSQAFKYPGFSIVRAPSVLINGQRYTDPKHAGEGLPRRKQESNFFITINTNKCPDTVNGEDVVRDALQHTLTELSTDAAIATYLKYGPKDAHYAEDRYADVVHSVDWQANVETGDKLHRIHAHIWMTISHYSQLQINIKMLQYLSRSIYNNYLNQQFAKLQGGYESMYGRKELIMKKLPYVHVKLLPQSDWTDVMKQYIHKGMQAS